MRSLLVLVLVACGDNRAQPDASVFDGRLDAADADAASSCGDGIVDPGEECDEGLRGLSGDGCSSTCRIETLAFTHPTFETMEWRRGHAMAYDPARDRIVMFGGRVHVGAEVDSDETWEYDGTAWHQVTGTIHPTARSGASMFYENGRIILFGGSGAGDTWALDGTGWTLLAPPTVPSGDLVGAAFDRQRNVGVLVTTTGTWEWSNGDWDLVGASPGDAAKVAYAGQGRVAYIATGVIAFWDGATWATSSPSTSVTPAGAAYDSTIDRLIVLARVTSSWAMGLWRWGGTDWLPLTTTGDAPFARECPLVFDASTTELVVFSGTSAFSFADTWTFDGSWHQRYASVPPPRTQTNLDFDARTGRVVMFGGVGSSVLRDDHWTYRDGQWQSVVLAPRPDARLLAAHAYDEKREKLVVWGGQTNYVPGVFTHGEDLWELDASGWHRRTSTGIAAFGSAAYDRAHAYTMIVSDRTWTWDGTTLVDRGPAPSGFATPSLAYDAKRDVLVLALPEVAGDVFYEWTGAMWLSRGAQAHDGQLFYDPVRATIIVTDRADGSVWEWDGTAVTQIGADAGFVEARPIYDRSSRSWFSFGGRSGWDTTIGRWQSTEIDERCDGSDADLDELTRCDDPDCWWRCAPQCPPYASCDPTAPRCGDGTCSALEDAALCPSDCT